MSLCSAGDKEFAKELLALIQDNLEIINPNALGKGIIYITWASAKVCPIVFPNPYQPSLQGHCFLMHNKKSN